MLFHSPLKSKLKFLVQRKALRDCENFHYGTAGSGGSRGAPRLSPPPPPPLILGKTEEMADGRKPPG